jgi:hypothetical protein
MLELEYPSLQRVSIVLAPNSIGHYPFFDCKYFHGNQQLITKENNMAVQVTYKFQKSPEYPSIEWLELRRHSPRMCHHEAR